MVEHAEADKRDDFIKLGEIARGINSGEKRPEQRNFNGIDGKLFIGSDARKISMR